MQTELRDKREKSAQAERLEKLLQLNEQSQYKTVVAQVIARDPTMWFDKAHLNLDGSKLLAFKLAADIQTLLDLGKPIDTWK